MIDVAGWDMNLFLDSIPLPSRLFGWGPCVQEGPAAIEFSWRYGNFCLCLTAVDLKSQSSDVFWAICCEDAWSLLLKA